MNEVTYLHGINLLPQFGPVRLGKLWNYFKNWEAAFWAKPMDLAAAGIEPEFINILLAHRRTVNLQQEMQKLEAAGIKLLAAQDPHYPKLLLEIPFLPYLLYYKGRMDFPDELCIAVVGTRKITTYGRTAGPRIIQPLIDAGITIVSGLAFGVDSQMQRLAVDSGKRTIAVLGGGLDDKSFYPKEHMLLADEIIQNGGAVISEHPIGTPPIKFNFIARNRIISGLSVGTVVIECNLKSGSLITAQLTVDQGRELFALPGSIYSEMSEGPNTWIKRGATPVTEADDIFNSLRIRFKSAEDITLEAIKGDSEVETKILQHLSLQPQLINDIIRLSGLPAGDVTAALTFLEIKGKIKNLGAQQYILNQ